MNQIRYTNNTHFNEKSLVFVTQSGQFNSQFNSRIKQVLSIIPPYDLNSGFYHFTLANKYAQTQTKLKNKKFSSKILTGHKLEIHVYTTKPEGEVELLHTFNTAIETHTFLKMSRTNYYRYLNSNRPYDNKYIISTKIIS
jgi:hypothetical protein